jgi:hypothetical protein
MDRDGKLRLELLDVYGDFLQEKVDITLRNQDLTDNLRVADLDAGRQILIDNLIGPPRNRYLLQIDVPSYRPVSRFVAATSGEAVEPRTLFFAVDPKKVISVDFPGYASLSAEARSLLEMSEKVLDFAGLKGEALYQKLDNIRRAGLLNIAAKTDRTRLSNGRTVLSYLGSEPGELSEIRGDRFFARVPKELREETKNSVPEEIFEPVPETLHHPPKGYSHAGSFKTLDRYGNLQLTFFAKGDDWMADIDIDDAAGLEHVFQVLRNSLTGRPTHPYDIHEILIRYQELDPGYRLRVRAG